MSDSPDNVVRIGGGGLLYEDAREQARLIAGGPAEDFTPDPPPPPPPAKPISKHTTAEPPKITQKNMPTEPDKGPDWREFFSTCLELAGITALTAAGWLVAPALGLAIIGVALILLGVGSSNLMSGR